jgi:glycerol-3-phosphate dehydrogenase (NAD(P)+)
VETLEDVLPASYRKSVVYISGPSHAEEVAMGKVTGLIAASENPMNSIRFRELIKSKGLLVYSSLDVVGVQVCAAAKNVVAIAFGCLDAIAEKSDAFGDNTESLLFAAGLNEILTIGRAMGATHPETFTSLSGVGDLDVTAAASSGATADSGTTSSRAGCSRSSPARRPDLAHLGDRLPPEGAVACKYVHEISATQGLKLPICDGLYRILNKELAPVDFIEKLLDGVQI